MDGHEMFVCAVCQHTYNGPIGLAQPVCGTCVDEIADLKDRVQAQEKEIARRNARIAELEAAIKRADGAFTQGHHTITGSGLSAALWDMFQLVRREGGRGYVRVEKREEG